MDKAADKEPDGATCFTCERFIGAADVCPYCGEPSVRSPVIRRLRWWAVCLALLGLVILYRLPASGEVPVRKIGRITSLMNFGRVRVAGEVQRKAYIGRDDGQVDYLSFIVADGSGELQVRAYGDVARKLSEAARVPQRGDRVTVTGRLRVTAGKPPRLVLEAVAHMQVESEERRPTNRTNLHK